MNNLNVGVLVSSLLAATGLGVYVYMNNADNNMEHVTNEISHDHDNHDEEDGIDYIKSNKKSINVKTKRRLNKASGTRRKR